MREKIKLVVFFLFLLIALTGCEITSEESMQEAFSESCFYRSHKYVIYADGIAMVV